jgi:hypothetical protein
MLSSWALKIIDCVSLYSDVEVPPPGAVATLALMHEDMNGVRDCRLLDSRWCRGGDYELVGEAYVHGTMRGGMARELKFEDHFALK